MKNRINGVSLAVVVALLLEGWALYVVTAPPGRWRPSLIAKDEPAAHALYETMIRTMQEAQSLSYSSHCSTPDDRSSSYRVWLKKPHGFRVDQTNSASLKSTTLVNDANHLWIHWTGDRLALLTDNEKTLEEDKSNIYLREPSLAGKGSICDRIAVLGTAWLGLILDPSIFHGYADPLESHIDGIRSRGVNRVRGETCDVIEISFMQARRTRYIWLSREDHLPRKLKEIVRGAKVGVTVEEWSNVAVNGGIAPKVLAWSPPEGYRQWEPPGPEDSLLQTGRAAPDFELRSARGDRIRLSEYRGKVVWLYVWDTDSPQCREEAAHLQRLHEEYGDHGLAVLGFNCTDDRRIARRFLRQHSVTFPTVLDSSESVAKLLETGYGYKAGARPLSFVIDPQGRVVDAWFGRDQDPNRVFTALEQAGL